MTDQPAVQVLSTKPTQLLGSGITVPTLVVNLDTTHDVELAPNGTFTPGATIPLTPGKNALWPPGSILYGRAASGNPSVALIQNGGGMGPSASDIAAQVAAGYRITDFVDYDAPTATVDGAGVATITLAAVPADTFWQIVRAVISCSGSANPEPQLRFYVPPAGTPIAQEYLRSGSNAGLFDEADYPGDGLWVPAGYQLVAQWTAAPVGETAALALQYRLLERS